MCLDHITHKIICPTKRVETTAYKVFRKNDDGSFRPEFNYGSRQRYFNDTWYKRKEPAKMCGRYRSASVFGYADMFPYPAGFHAYKTVQGAQAHNDQTVGQVVAMVKLRMVRTIGSQDQGRESYKLYTCFVADEMKITKIIKEY